jgi:hypothetical protein
MAHQFRCCPCPFRCSRAPLTKEQLVPNQELRQQIEAWLEQHQQHGS